MPSGAADDFINAGCSAWKRDGSLLAELGSDMEAILFIDSERRNRLFHFIINIFCLNMLLLTGKISWYALFSPAGNNS